MTFGALAARSLWLQGFDQVFLQEQGSARYSRELEVPAHRGRIVDRAGEPLAISTPVKSLWAFPAKLDATPAQRAKLAAVLDAPAPVLARKLDAGEDFVFVARQLAARGGRSRDGHRHRGPPRAERVSALLPRRRNDEPTSWASPAIATSDRKASSSRSRNGWADIPAVAA